jgi:mannose-6-phosphate isomerase-like protein (cupin superfamily)
MTRWSLAHLDAARAVAGKRYHEFVHEAGLSAGLYALARGSEDAQKPHTEDEVYVVMRGRARFRAEGEDAAVAPGDVLFVKAGVEHRFHDVSEDLQVLVVFGPAEGSQA